MIKLYSLILTEDEIKLFSERIERYFSFRDDSEDVIDLGFKEIKQISQDDVWGGLIHMELKL